MPQTETASARPILSTIAQESCHEAASCNSGRHREGGDLLLIARGERRVTVERVSRGEAALLRALAAKASLGMAALLASEAAPSFDLIAALRHHVDNHVVVALHAPRASILEGQQ